MTRLGFDRLEDRTAPAILPTTYAVGQDTATVGARMYDDPTMIRARTGDPSLGGPEAQALASDGSFQFRVGMSPFFGGARVARANVTGDAADDLIVGTGPGTATQVRVYDGTTQAEVFRVAPFEAAFTGGVYVAAGDLDGDGVGELIVTPDEGGGPRVLVFRGGDFSPRASFLGIDDANFRGGARAAAADFDADGADDLVVAAGVGGGPRVAVFGGTTVGGTPARLFGDFFVFETALRNGAFVAAGDVDGDTFADLVGGGGPGGGPRVLVLSGAELRAGRATPLANFFDGDPNTRGGVRVAVKNLDGDGRADLVTGSGPIDPVTKSRLGGGTRSAVYAGSGLAGTPTPVRVGDAFASFSFANGVFVG